MMISAIAKDVNKYKSVNLRILMNYDVSVSFKLSEMILKVFQKCMTTNVLTENQEGYVNLKMTFKEDMF